MLNDPSRRVRVPAGPILEMIKKIARDVVLFCESASGLRLRKYQEEVARAVVDSVLKQKGLTFVVIFPRQSGKNELQAQIETFLLTTLGFQNAEIVKASPTWKPQTLNAMRRLARVLDRNLFTTGRWVKESGYIFRFLSARVTFLSGSPTANVVGATANTLLECDEAQDISIEKWDKDFAPMAASTHATRVFWGTAWTSRTLLARERRAAEAAQAIDGEQRVWVLAADDVAKEVPAYGKFVAEQVARLGRNHPLVRTQYYSEEIDSEGGMFTAQRLQLMQGDHPRREKPEAGKLYAMTIDVAGEDEGAKSAEGRESAESLANPKRDSTSVTILEVDLSTLTIENAGAPTYLTVCRYTWTGKKHTWVYGQVKNLIAEWNARYMVVDSTGVGAGLASFLDRAYPGKVIQFQFTQQSKSKLGWGFLAVVETGRYKDYSPPDKLFWRQLRYTQHEVLEGPGKILKWSVPEGTRDELSGEIVHDDLVISAALCAVLDDQEWSIRASPLVIRGIDPLVELDRQGF